MTQKVLGKYVMIKTSKNNNIDGSYLAAVEWWVGAQDLSSILLRQLETDRTMTAQLMAHIMGSGLVAAVSSPTDDM